MPTMNMIKRLKSSFRGVRSAFVHDMTLMTPVKGRPHGQPVTLIPNKLYFACYPPSDLPADDDSSLYIPIMEYVHYDPFYDDFGPLNLAVVYRFVRALDNLLKDIPNRRCQRVVCCATDDERDRVNGAFLMAGFMIIIAGYSADKAAALVNSAQPPPFIGFRDASLGPPIYGLQLVDVIKALDKAIKLNWFKFDDFDPEEYEYYERVENGDFNWIIPGKILSFCGPHDKSYICNDYPYHAPEIYFDYFRKHNITTIVRLNKKMYDASRFTDAGFDHHDLFFIDGSTPSNTIVRRFIDIVDQAKGGVAIHCKAGLGRTGTLIACWMMKEWRLTAPLCMAWLRICRPGSVIGPQQTFLIDKQQYCWMLGKNRSNSPKRASPSGIPRAAKHRAVGESVSQVGPARSVAVLGGGTRTCRGLIASKSVPITSPGSSLPSIKATTSSRAAAGYDETTINKYGQSQGDRLLELKAKHQHAPSMSLAANEVLLPSPPTARISGGLSPKIQTPSNYSSATTPIKQLKVSSKRVPQMLTRSSRLLDNAPGGASTATPALPKTSTVSAKRALNFANGNVSSGTMNNKSKTTKGNASNIPISRVTVASTTTTTSTSAASALRQPSSTAFRAANGGYKKLSSSPRTHPYPTTTSTGLSTNLSKINLAANKYELRPRKNLHSPQRFDPTYLPTKASISVNRSLASKTRATRF